MIILYPIIIITPIFGFFTFHSIGWSMFFSCLISYLIQLVCASFCVYPDEVMLDMNKEEISVADLDIFYRKEKLYRRIYTSVLLIGAILDLFPFVSMSANIGFFFGFWEVYEGGIIVSILCITSVLLMVYFVFQNNTTTFFEVYEKFVKTGLTPQEELKQKQKKAKTIRIEQKNKEIKKYGIEYKPISRRYNIFVNEITQKLFIKNKEISFVDILAFECQDNSHTIKSSSVATTRTDAKSVVGRSVIGGVLAGTAGAIIGGSTASKTTVISEPLSMTFHNYRILITINSISSPLVTLEIGSSQGLANKLSAILTVIIKRNN